MEKVIKVSLDRFEEDYAVIYSNEDTKRFDLPREMIGDDAKPGMRLLLHIDGGDIIGVELDRQETTDARERIRRKYQRLHKGQK